MKILNILENLDNVVHFPSRMTPKADQLGRNHPELFKYKIGDKVMYDFLKQKNNIATIVDYMFGAEVYERWIKEKPQEWSSYDAFFDGHGGKTQLWYVCEVSDGTLIPMYELDLSLAPDNLVKHTF